MTMTATELAKIQSIADTVQQQHQRIHQLTEQLIAERAVLHDLEEHALPEAMGEEECVTLPNGNTIVVETTYHGHISEDAREIAMSQLANLGRTDIISTEVTVRFGKNEYASAMLLVETLRRNVPQYPLRFQVLDADQDLVAMIKHLIATVIPERIIQVRQGVHPSTLKAFVKQQYTQGSGWDPEPFGAYRRTAARVILADPSLDG